MKKLKLLLLIGWLCGALAGFGTGIAIGFNRKVQYWVSPLVRLPGPIPSTAWIPLALIAFPGAVSARTFLIALAVWFPTTVLTSSGIANIKQSCFEAAATLGARLQYTVFQVGYRRPCRMGSSACSTAPAPRSSPWSSPGYWAQNMAWAGISTGRRT